MKLPIISLVYLQKHTNKGWLIFAGDDSCVHHCEDKEDDGDSCVECWANSEENNTKGKNKKKKKKSKMLKCDEHVSVII